MTEFTYSISSSLTEFVRSLLDGEKPEPVTITSSNEKDSPHMSLPSLENMEISSIRNSLDEALLDVNLGKANKYLNMLKIKCAKIYVGDDFMKHGIRMDHLNRLVFSGKCSYTTANWYIRNVKKILSHDWSNDARVMSSYSPECGYWPLRELARQGVNISTLVIIPISPTRPRLPIYLHEDFPKHDDVLYDMISSPAHIPPEYLIQYALGFGITYSVHVIHHLVEKDRKRAITYLLRLNEQEVVDELCLYFPEQKIKSDVFVSRSLLDTCEWEEYDD